MSSEWHELLVLVSNLIVPSSASFSSAGYQLAAWESPNRNTSGASGFSPTWQPLGSESDWERWQSEA